MATMLSAAELLRTTAEERLPLVVLTDNLFSFVSWRIRVHTLSAYNHVGVCVRPRRVAEQGWRFREADLAGYLEGRHRVKLWRADWANEEQCAQMRQATEELLERRGRYDWLGIVGQALGWRWLNSRRHYCSEAVAWVLRAGGYAGLDAHPSPGDLDRAFRESSGWTCIGVFDPNLRGGLD